MTNYCKYCGLSTCCCPSLDELREMATLLEALEGSVIDTQSRGLLRPAGQHAGVPGRVAREAGSAPHSLPDNTSKALVYRQNWRK